MKAINETIANAIVESIEGNNDTFSVEVEANDTLLVVDGSFEIDGYCEDDYFNGTGTWVTTYVSVCIDNIEAYDEDGNEIDVDCDIAEIERSVERLIAYNING